MSQEEFEKLLKEVEYHSNKQNACESAFRAMKAIEKAMDVLELDPDNESIGKGIRDMLATVLNIRKVIEAYRSDE